MNRTRVAGLALALLLPLGMWWASLAVYDAHKMRDALGWYRAVQHGQTPYRWSFEGPAELLTGHGLRDFRWAEGAVHGEMTDPYFYLNLEGRYLDPRLYALLELRLYSAAGGDLQLFHRRDEARIHATELIPVAAGWQTLRLDLDALPWHSKPMAGSGAVEPSGWSLPGAGPVTALRIDPVQQGAFAVDEIALLPRDRLPAVDPEVLLFTHPGEVSVQGLADRLGRIWLLAQEQWLRTPESAHRARLDIARTVPAAVVFPYPPGRLDGEPETPSAGLAEHWPGLLYLAALVALAVSGRRRGGRPAVEVLALLALLQAWLWWLPQWPGLAGLALVVPILWAAWRLAEWPSARLFRGDARAWLLLAPLMAAGLLLMLFFPETGPEAAPLSRRLPAYLAWALLQQFLLVAVFLGRLRTVAGPLAVLLGAGVFGAMHFPNLALMLSTWLLGLVLLRVYERHGGLAALAVTHALLAVGFDALASRWFWLSRAVGPAFLAPL